MAKPVGRLLILWGPERIDASFTWIMQWLASVLLMWNSTHLRWFSTNAGFHHRFSPSSFSSILLMYFSINNAKPSLFVTLLTSRARRVATARPGRLQRYNAQSSQLHLLVVVHPWSSLSLQHGKIPHKRCHQSFFWRGWRGPWCFEIPGALRPDLILRMRRLTWRVRQYCAIRWFVFMNWWVAS